MTKRAWTVKINRLRRDAESLQKLRSIASDQLLDADLAHDDLTRQCREAWNKYHVAKHQSENENR